MALESIAIAGLTAFGWQAARQGVTYASEAAGGALGMKVLNGTVSEFVNTGASYFGKVGEAVGRVFGKAVAGQGITEIKSQADNFSNIAKKIGGLAIDYASGNGSKEIKPEGSSPVQIVSADGSIEEVAGGENAAQSSGFTATALEIGKVAMPLIGAAAIASGCVPVAALGLASAAASALPKIAESIMSSPKSEKSHDTFEEIIIGGTRAFIKESAGIIVGNYVTADQVIKAYNSRVQQGGAIGKAIGDWLPTPIGNYFVQAGECLGTIDAGRFAMSDAVVHNAIKAGETAETITKTGLGIADKVISHQIGQTSGSSWWDTARKAAWIGTGVIVAAGILAIAPEAAPFVASSSFLSVADKVVDWAKGRIYPGQSADEAAAESASLSSEESIQKFNAQKPPLMDVVNLSDSKIEEMIAQTPVAAPAA